MKNLEEGVNKYMNKITYMYKLLLIVTLINILTHPLLNLGHRHQKVQSLVVAEAEAMPPKRIITPTPTPMHTAPHKASRSRSLSPKRVRTVTKQLTSSGVWDRLVQCEASGNWSANTGNGFYGGLQFTLESWHEFGGTGMPYNASRETQIQIAKNIKAGQGWGAWPACSKRLGLR
jgi:hypothetical protein